MVHSEENNMRCLGLIGGTSWHSTVEYYSAINQAVNDHFGNNTNPPLVIANVNQADVHQFQRDNNWRKVAQVFVEAAKRLEAAGAEAISFCANTPHKVYEHVQAEIRVPMIHIADATAAAIHQREVTKVCFIGTQYSMEDDFVTGRIASHGIGVSVPQNSADIVELHRIIQQELTFNNILPESKQYVMQQILQMVSDGAQGVVLGCTEFPLMFADGDLDIPVFNTTKIHAAAAVDFILNQSACNSTD